jgi:hypothetical protein
MVLRRFRILRAAKSDPRFNPEHRRLKLTAAALCGLLGASPALAQSGGQHGHAAHLGASVMPFDLGRSTHVFTPTADGGTQEVISKDSDAAQVALIRSHLRKEAEAFARGDYADPASIHGQAMPGLAKLRAGAARVRVGYEDIPNGAQVRFKTQDPKLTAAVHEWFSAQVHDHGADATMRR